MENSCFYSAGCNKKDCDKDFCMRKYKLDSLYQASLLTEAQKDDVILLLDADNTDFKEFSQLAAIKNDIVNFVSSGKNLYIFSQTCGNGKTSWSIKLIKAYLNKIWAKSDLTCKALFVNVPRFLMAIKENFTTPNEYARYTLANIEKADLVVWDDIGSKAGSEYDIEKILGFVSTRLAEGKSNIFTSNLNRANLNRALDARLTSRIYGQSTVIELHGSDKRELSRK